MGITVERHDGGVAVVTLSEEAARNALSRASMHEMSNVLGSLLDDSTCKAIVLTGTARFFCTGADIDEFADSIDDGSIGNLVDELTSVLHPLELRLRRSPTVFIAAINGVSPCKLLALTSAPFLINKSTNLVSFPKTA